ncbi:DUF742 domain-containing protein [Actinosynnema sp. NPDC047251]|uniref:DUF742 domain-containing protein n=1 Tax=Saccharothrix espanaensis (strain ATCC 51144 / DSM 44229 / JCM 9112 / NBRC 15066 / NRRL 15764) TaxID=1179773 RepID=K0KA18_SACES|nr:DUF742 domain-containing protein [Saccharothrix espanaensis]CCH33493.1 hypothetical protein BN6_62440 [Saccharothrix espanaensis DSM 44229]
MSQDEDPDASFAALLNGFSLSGRRSARPAEEPDPVERPTRPHPVFQDDPDFPREEAASSVRAYSWTGGRTTSSHQLEIETLVSVVDWEFPGALQSEYQEVLNLVAAPRSVAEVAALLRLPLGVAKVLLGDMAERGLIDVHGTASAEEPDLGLMERVLAGLRRL